MNQAITTMTTRSGHAGRPAQSTDDGVRTALIAVALGIWGVALPMTLVSSLAPLGA
jgi:hypothetical protein